ncbi:MAG: glycosyltransferase [Deltaproteobacteria bacterium]|nr:glycosyltransferase [Deltaproteobacteria bacterium]
MPEKLNILFAIGSLDIGGAEAQMAALISRLHDRRFFCHLFVLQKEGYLKQYIRDLGVPTYDGGLERGDLLKAPWKLIPAQLRLIRILLLVRPVVVHSFLPLVTCMGALGGRLTRVPLVITSRRALGTHQERYNILRLLDLAANRLSHLVTVNSRAVWEDTVQRDHIDPAKLALIYNGVDVSTFDSARSSRRKTREILGIGSTEKVIIVIGNLIPYKGHGDLLKAASEALTSVPQALFLFAGEDRGIGGRLEKMAAELGVSSRVRFLGLRHDIPQLLAASDISVVASHEEGFSNVILESMASGLPVVATRVGGNPEAVVDGVTGWLVPPRNPTAMAEKIIDLLNDIKKAEFWGRKGRERVLDENTTSIDEIIM